MLNKATLVFRSRFTSHIKDEPNALFLLLLLRRLFPPRDASSSSPDPSVAFIHGLLADGGTTSNAAGPTAPGWEVLKQG
jgi:hypothetical protein